MLPNSSFLWYVNQLAQTLLTKDVEDMPPDSSPTAIKSYGHIWLACQQAKYCPERTLWRAILKTHLPPPAAACQSVFYSERAMRQTMLRMHSCYPLPRLSAVVHCGVCRPEPQPLTMRTTTPLSSLLPERPGPASC